jgi:hypothetical protein
MCGEGVVLNNLALVLSKGFIVTVIVYEMFGNFSCP